LSADPNVLHKVNFSRKQKKEALKYLQKSRQNLKLTRGELHSEFSKRLIQKHRYSMLQNLRNGTSVQQFIIDSVKSKVNEKESVNLLRGTGVRSLSNELNIEQREEYKNLCLKNLKRERTILS
jgi:hypothetical protein